MNTDDVILPVRIRASEAHTWLTCGRRAIHRQLHRRLPSRATPVAAALGRIVHERLTGEPSEAPEIIQYDGITRTARELESHAESVTRRVGEWMKELDSPRVIYTEQPVSADYDFKDVLIQLRGRVDLVLESVEHGGLHYVDVKSGRWDQRDALIQLGIYVLAGTVEGHEVTQASVIHAPRGGNDWTAITRRAGDLAKEALQQIRYIAEISRAPGGTLAVPGAHCDRCPNTGCFFHKERDNDEISW